MMMRGWAAGFMRRSLARRRRLVRPRSYRSVVVARLRTGNDAGDIRIFSIGSGLAAVLTLLGALGPTGGFLLLLLALGLLAVALVDGRSLCRWHACSSLCRSASLHPRPGCADESIVRCPVDILA